MSRYRSRSDVEMQVDVSTGVQTAHTPWGIVTIRRGDMIVPIGPTTSVPIPGDLWEKWFERMDKPTPLPAFVAPDKPFADWTRRELEQYSVEILGEEPPKFPRKPSLIKWVKERAEQRSATAARS